MNWISVGRGILAVGMMAMGVLHWMSPAPFERAIPHYLPWPHGLVLMSGVFEVLGGVGLFCPPLRTAAAYGLIALYLAVFPANVEMALHWDQWVQPEKRWLLFARLPLQAGLIFWAYRVRN